MRLIDALAELEGVHQFRDVLGGKLPDGPATPNAERAAGLELLATRRREGIAPARLFDERGESWGALMVGVPELDYRVHVARNPDLVSKDIDTRNKAWHKFFRLFGWMYGVDDSIGKKKPNPGRIIVK